MITKHIISGIIFTFALLGINYLHFRFLPVNVVFYSALIDVLVAVLVAGFISWFFLFGKKVEFIIFAQLLIIFVLGGYIFAISVPTVIDRSFSLYILEKLEQHRGALKKEAFDSKITEEFMQEHRLSDARLTEQTESGTVQIKDGCVMLTKRGHRIARFSRWYRQNMLPQHRLLMGEYTDALTDPFRRPSMLNDFECGQ